MDKYERAKEAARKWHALLEEARVENARLLEEVVKWKKICESLPDEEELKELNRTVKALKKENRELEEKYSQKNALLEREKILLEGRVQQLEEANRDLRERYVDLKQDYREQQKWSRDRQA
jgi:phage-related tail protein